MTPRCVHFALCCKLHVLHWTYAQLYKYIEGQNAGSLSDLALINMLSHSVYVYIVATLVHTGAVAGSNTTMPRRTSTSKGTQAVTDHSNLCVRMQACNESLHAWVMHICATPLLLVNSKHMAGTHCLSARAAQTTQTGLLCWWAVLCCTRWHYTSYDQSGIMELYRRNQRVQNKAQTLWTLPDMQRTHTQGVMTRK